MTVLIGIIAVLTAAAVIAFALGYARDMRPAQRPKQPESPGNNLLVLPLERGAFNRHVDDAMALTVDEAATLSTSRGRHPSSRRTQ